MDEWGQDGVNADPGYRGVMRGCHDSVGLESSPKSATYLIVSRGHLLIEILVTVDGQLQLLHDHGQPTLAARLRPALYP